MKRDSGIPPNLNNSPGENLPRKVRPAAVAGLFYPGTTGVLAREVEAMLAAVAPAHADSARPPKAIIAPHAGYVYSGAIAACVYAPLAAMAPE